MRFMQPHAHDRTRASAQALGSSIPANSAFTSGLSGEHVSEGPGGSQNQKEFVRFIFRIIFVSAAILFDLRALFCGNRRGFALPAGAIHQMGESASNYRSSRSGWSAPQEPRLGPPRQNQGWRRRCGDVHPTARSRRDPTCWRKLCSRRHLGATRARSGRSVAIRVGSRELNLQGLLPAA